MRTEPLGGPARLAGSLCAGAERPPERKWSCSGEEERARARRLVRAADMAQLGRLLVPLAALVLFLWTVPWAQGRRSNVRILTDENWTSLLEGEWMIEL